jgi:hypothetical protein
VADVAAAAPAQIHFVARLMELGGEATHRGTYLAQLALLQTALLVPWAWGRAVFVRACRLGLRGQRPGAAALRVGAAPFAGYLYATVLLRRRTGPRLDPGHAAHAGAVRAGRGRIP